MTTHATTANRTGSRLRKITPRKRRQVDFTVHETKSARMPDVSAFRGLTAQPVCLKCKTRNGLRRVYGIKMPNCDTVTLFVKIAGKVQVVGLCKTMQDINIA